MAFRPTLLDVLLDVTHESATMDSRRFFIILAVVAHNLPNGLSLGQRP
jgi:hypothetical protein